MAVNTPHFAASIATQRRALGLTQQDVAERGGPSDTTQRKIESGGQVNVSTQTLRKYDAALGWQSGASAAVLNGGDATPTSSGITSGSRQQPANRRGSRSEESEHDELGGSVDVPIVSILELVSLLDELRQFTPKSHSQYGPETLDELPPWAHQAIVNLESTLRDLSLTAEEVVEFATKVATNSLGGMTRAARLFSAYDDAVLDGAVNPPSGNVLRFTVPEAEPAPPLDDEQLAAYRPKLGEKGSPAARDQDETADRPDPEGPEGGA